MNETKNAPAGRESTGVIAKVAGPLIVATGMADVQMYDVVRVSDKRLIGEVIELRKDRASIQVYEETAGLGPGEPVYSTGEPLSVELAPGLIEGIFDGIQRPLDRIFKMEGDRISRGIDVPKLNREKKWRFLPAVKIGDEVTGGDTLGTVEETPAVTQKIMVPPNVSGAVEWIFDGEATIVEPIARLKQGTAPRSSCPCSSAGRFAGAGPMWKKPPQRNPWSPASGSSTRCFPSRRAAWRPFPAPSVRAKRSFSTSLPNGRTRTSSFTSAAASAAMK